jgi:hypothetical protein
MLHFTAALLSSRLVLPVQYVHYSYFAPLYRWWLSHIRDLFSPVNSTVFFPGSEAGEMTKKSASSPGGWRGGGSAVRVESGGVKGGVEGDEGCI